MRSYKTTCPRCGKNTLYVTPNNGISYCFRASCHYLEMDGTSIRPQRQQRSDYVQEIRDLYKQLAAYYHSSLDKPARDYLHARGITDDTIQKLQIGYCPLGTLPLYKNPIAREAGIVTAKYEAFLGNRIIFPYFRTDDTITDLRGRILDPDEELTYLSPYGGIHYRGALYPYNNHLSFTAQKVIIAESEIKAIMAYQAGYTAIGIPGISAWRKGYVQQDNQDLVIVFDTEREVSTQHDVHVAITKLAQQIDNVKVATLPLDAGMKKAEIDTFILGHGIDLFRKIVDSAIEYSTWKALHRIEVIHGITSNSSINRTENRLYSGSSRRDTRAG